MRKAAGQQPRNPNTDAVTPSVIPRAFAVFLSHTVACSPLPPAACGSVGSQAQRALRHRPPCVRVTTAFKP